MALEVLGKVSYGFGDHEFTFKGGVSRASGRTSRVTLKSILVLNGKSPFDKRRKYMPLTNPALFRRDCFMCAYCGRVTRTALTRDHIVPMSRGGRDCWVNCVASCVSCNTRKGSKLLEELCWGLLYVPYVPNHQEGLILENRNILQDQMDILLQMVPKHSRLVGHA
ncbi:MAG: HNH endonuclease [Casimicrobiaceae bacterium]